MKLTVLVENTSCCTSGAAHGLSLYIETANHRILFDAGPDGDLLKQNAAILGIDLRQVDLAILSHGHYDHANGLPAFLELNQQAPVIMQRHALEPHYASENAGLRSIGVPDTLKKSYSNRLILTEDRYRIDDSLLCFSDISTAYFLSESNLSLLETDGDHCTPDCFLHEQNLLIEENGKLFLIAGCAHRGIINIIRRASEISGRLPNAVYAGFHLTNPGKGLDEPEEFVRSVGTQLVQWPCRYYTGHCTGSRPFRVLKEQLGDRIEYLSGGRTFEE